MSTKSSTLVGANFSHELRLAFYNFVKGTKKKLNWHVRQACIMYLAANGVDVSGIDNPEQGERTDLKRPTRAETEAIIAPRNGGVL